MGRTLLDKIWDAHTVRTEEGGRTVLYIDRQYIHEVTSPVAFAGLARRGVGVVHPDRITATVDHNIPTVDWVLPLYRFVHSALMVEPSGAFSDSVAHRKALKPSASGTAT